MTAKIFEGVWEDVAVKHAHDLRGHRVEIRVLDAVKTHPPVESWASFEAKVAAISRGKRIPKGRMYTAEDFYSLTQ